MGGYVFIGYQQTPADPKSSVLKERRDIHQRAKVYGIASGAKVNVDSHARKRDR